MVRYLRYAAITISLIVFGTISVLWLRSFWRDDHVQGLLSRGFSISCTSTQGRLMVGLWPRGREVPLLQWGFSSSTVEDPQTVRQWYRRHAGSPFKFSFDRSELSYLHMPHWAPVLISGLLAVALAVGRFQLRTLIVVMTVVAIALVLLRYRPERSQPKKQPPTWLQESGYKVDVS